MNIIRLMIFLIIMLFIPNINSYCQSSAFYIKVFGALQSVDKRIVGESKSGKEHLIELNNKTPPDKTTQIGLEGGVKFNLRENLSINTGFNYSFLRNNFIRHYEWQILFDKPGGISLPKIVYLYNYHLLGNTTALDYKFIDVDNYSILIGFKLNTYFRFLSVYHETILTHETKRWNKKDFFSFELSPSVGYRYRTIEIDMYYRVFHFIKIDRALFSKKNTGYGALKNDYETYNLPKFGISLKYWFGFTRKKENKPINIDK